MDLSVRVDPGASWQADFSRNGCRRRQVPSFCDLALNRLTFAEDLSMMPTRVEFPTAARGCVRMKRRTRATVDNSCTAVQHLTKALFLSKPVEPLLGNLDYVVQDDEAHNVTELVLPSYSDVEIEVAYDPVINFHVEETVFGIDGDLNSKPLIEERHTRFIADGKGKARWIPRVDDTESIDRKCNYHFKPRTPKRSVGSCYTMGFKLRTREAGVYKCWLGFLTDEIDGQAQLRIMVEDKPTTRMTCTVHGRGCKVRPGVKRTLL